MGQLGDKDTNWFNMKTALRKEVLFIRQWTYNLIPNGERWNSSGRNVSFHIARRSFILFLRHHTPIRSQINFFANRIKRKLINENTENFHFSLWWILCYQPYNKISYETFQNAVLFHVIESFFLHNYHKR